MSIINQVKLNIGESISNLPVKISQKEHIKVKNWRIIKESIDARDKSAIKMVYSVEYNYDESAAREEYEIPCITGKMPRRPVVVGFGPCGIFCGLVLARAGLKPIIIERGWDVDKRAEQVRHFWKTGELDINSNVQFGEGGAGTFSDGKLTTGIKDERLGFVLSELAKHGGPDDILFKAKPHIGTDVLREVVKNIRLEIIESGGEILFGKYVSGMKLSADNRIEAIQISDTESSEERFIDAEDVVFAIGHSSRDTFRWLEKQKIQMSQKPFSIGVRVEHPQAVIDRAQYGDIHENLGLPAADYKLNVRVSDGRGVYTFCMCPGGEVITASSQTGGVVTNGMSNHDRNSGFANSAVLCDVRTEDFGSDHVLAGVEFQEKYERLAFVNGRKQAGMLPEEIGKYVKPECLWREFRDDVSNTVTESLPEFCTKAIKEAMPLFGKKLKGFDDDETKMYAVEARSSSPVRFRRDESFCGYLTDGKRIEGFYPAGEGAGYAGGIVSAAVDGIRIAEAIIRKYI